MTPPCRFVIDDHHWELLIQSIQAVTIDPLRNIFTYAFPFLGVAGSLQITKEADPTRRAILPPLDKRVQVLDVIDQLKTAAEIPGEIDIYTALKYTYTSYGGCLFTPAISIPYHHLFHSDGSSLGSNTAAVSAEQYTDEEARFLIARQLTYLKEHIPLIRLALKVVFISALFYFYSLTAVIAKRSLILATGCLYVLTEHYFQRRLDAGGVRILSRLPDRSLSQAIEAAKTALRKESQQNRDRLAVNSFYRLYITPSGTNLLDLFSRPTSESRVNSLILLNTP